RLVPKLKTRPKPLLTWKAAMQLGGTLGTRLIEESSDSGGPHGVRKSAELRPKAVSEKTTRLFIPVARPSSFGALKGSVEPRTAANLTGQCPSNKRSPRCSADSGSTMRGLCQ